MAETASCRRIAAARILAALAAAVCLLAIFAGIGARQAYAAESGNVSFSVPAKVPFAVKADGTTVGPSAAAWRIENTGTRPLRMRDVAASGFEDGSSVKAVSEAMPVAGTSSRGIWSVSAGRGGASLTPSTDGTIEIPVGGGAGFTWSADLAAGTKHAAGPAPAALGAVSFTLGNAEPVAFAVYSSDDQSLDFYKRMDVPEAGDAYDGKTVTEVYTGFEDRHYVFETEGSNHVPWFDIRKKVKSVQVVDDGIRPYYTHAWFAQMESLTDCDIAKLDTSRSAVFYDMFNGCASLESLDLTHMDTSSAIYMGYMLKDCPKLKTVDVSSFDTSKCQDLSIFFGGDSALTEIRGLGNWDTSSCRWMNLMFNGCGSLTRIDGLENWDVRSVETMESMFEQCQKLQSVDISHFEGKSLKSAKAMFFHCYSLTTVDVSKLVTGTCTIIGCMFDGCTGLTSIQGLDKWDVSNIKECHQAFYYCCSLQKIDLANWRFSPSGTVQAMFYNCSSLRELDLSGFDLHEAESGWGLFEQAVRLQRITLGPDWKWVDVNGYLPAPSADSIPGADGKWYSTTTGQGYAPADIPAGKADTYVASKELLPKVAFAVYSADDGSLDFYKRAFCDVPVAGDAFEGKTATEVYTGFEDTEYRVVSVGSDGNSWDSDAVTDTPWFGRRKDIKTVQVVDGGIKPKSVQSWFQGLDNATSLSVTKLDVSACASFSNAFANCRAATSIDVSGWSVRPTDMTQMFYMCKSVPSLDLSGFDGSRNITLNSTFHACFTLDDIKFGDKWTTAAVENFNCAFFGTKFRKLDVSGWNTSKGYMFRGTFGDMGNLEEIDMSGWTNAGAENEPAILSTFSSDTKLRTVTVGTGWDWSKSNAKLPAISDKNVAGADGKWYAASNGTGYAPADIPSGKADTYYSVAPSTFAVFSSDDCSLDFYNRAGKPVVGDTWQGKSVDGVYVGFETASYDYNNSIPITDGLGNTCSTPWYSVKDSVKQVGVVDSGIKASSLRCWFANMLNVETVDISKLEPAAPIDCTWTFINCRKMTSVSLPDGLTPSLMSDLFYACMNLTSDGLSMPNLNMSSCTRSFAAFLSCYSLTSVPGIENWNVRNVRDFRDMFANCENLTADLSLWDVSSSSSGSDLPRNFNSDAPGVILPKPWQPTAFAVYSADDGSLDFYKREYGKMPKAGAVFEGKAATEVYTGFEGTRYSIQTSDDGMARDWTCKALPWWDRRDSVKTATVVDTGIAPTSICGWFMRMPNLTAADLSNLDCSGTYTAWCAFLRCTSLASLKSPMNFNPIDLSDFVYSCNNLKDLDTSSWNMGRCTNIGWAFAGCKSLETLPGAEGWDTSSLNYADGAFAYCNLLKLDCSNWNVASSTYNVNFNQGTPYITLPKAWQTVSADIASGGDGVADDAEATGGSDVGADDGPASESPSSAEVDNLNA